MISDISIYTQNVRMRLRPKRLQLIFNLLKTKGTICILDIEGCKYFLTHLKHNAQCVPKTLKYN